MLALNALLQTSIPDVTLVWNRPPKMVVADLCSPSAITYAKSQQLSPMTVATQWVSILLNNAAVKLAWVTEPGYINVIFNDNVLLEHALVPMQAQPSNGQRILIEYVSANPTGPLHMGHARQAVIGDTLAALYSYQGYDVVTEYYYNDEGNQIYNLTCSVQAHMKSVSSGHKVVADTEGASHIKDSIVFSKEWYQGDYVRDIARQALRMDIAVDDMVAIQDFAVKTLFAQQQQTLQALGTHFHNFVLESSFHTNGAVKAVLDSWTLSGHTYEEEGAVYFQAGKFGAAKSYVARKSNGTYTYFVPDVAYHIHKLERRFTRLINVHGNDHADTMTRVRGGLAALGFNTTSLEYVLHAMVQVVQNKQPVRPSKRAGNYVTLDDMLESVGSGALRFSLLGTSNEKDLVLDLNHLQEQGMDNPVYYVQMAHARISTLLHKKYHGLAVMLPEGKIPTALRTVAISVLQWPSIVKKCIDCNSPYPMQHYLTELAGHVHTAYGNLPMVDDLAEDEREAAGTIFMLAKQRLLEGLTLLHIEAPESMTRPEAVTY